MECLKPLICRVPFDKGIHVCVYGHHDNDDVEGVDQPDVNHLDVGCFWDHLVDGGLYSCHHHHGGDCYHYSILNKIMFKIVLIF